MIIYCAADPIYFNHYFDLWAGQLNKFYPEHYKLVALYKPNKGMYDKCNDYNVLYKQKQCDQLQGIHGNSIVHVPQ